MKKSLVLLAVLVLTAPAPAQKGGFNPDLTKQRFGPKVVAPDKTEIKKVEEITKENIAEWTEGKIKGTITVTSTKEQITATWEGKVFVIVGYPDPKKLSKGTTFKPEYIWRVGVGKGTEQNPFNVLLLPEEKEGKTTK